MRRFTARSTGRATAVLALAPLLLGARLHPIHVSVTNVDYNERTRALEISARVFVDDLEAALLRGGAPALRIGTPREARETDARIAAYLAANLRIEGSGAPAFVGKETEGGAVWLYVEIPQEGPPRALHVRNTLLMDLHPDQTNLLHARVGGTERSAAFRQGRESTTLDFASR
jgi:hypothetical protein